ncbi:MAG: protein kinase [Sphingopyxis sp.]|uniref:serine/threonine-protein kinase n=1 Tax=Sphingopyxis sp. TaxID=1908224 RepID=UPI003D80FA58
MKSLGRYSIEGRLGEGAMADVYRAVDPSIGRQVAIKVLKPEYARNPGLNVRFLREARAAGALSHPNIATIYEVGEADGTAYIAMELIEGQPLDHLLQSNGRLPYERVLVLGQQLAGALAYAHRMGVVHRDVKPSNILLSKDGRTAKLVDFGVARIDEPDPDGNNEHLARTQFGQMIGTPRYMSPEQALSLPVDHRSDLFSLGIVLYEMVTGKAAFPGIGLATLAIQIAQERVEPVERSASDCPPGLRFIIDKLLAKKPEQRFPDGDAVRTAIMREMSASEDSAQPRRGVSLRVKLPLLLAAVTLAVLAICGTLISTREEQAFEDMAATSGRTIAAFVASNAGVVAVDNAGLPADQQDWGALQAFVASASEDSEIRAMTVVDAGNVIRAATDRRRIGTRYAAPQGEARIGMGNGAVVSYVGSNQQAGMRIVQPIRYAGARYGTVDIVVRTEALAAAASNTQLLLVMLSLVVMIAVMIVGYMSGAAVTRPLARLRKALDDAATSRFALRISHRRGDEFGQAFDAFNRAAGAAEATLVAGTPEDEASMLATRIAEPADAAMPVRQVA